MASTGAYEEQRPIERECLGQYLDFPILITPRVEFLSKYTAVCNGTIDPSQKGVRAIQRFIQVMGSMPSLTPLDPEEYPEVFMYQPSAAKLNWDPETSELTARKIYSDYLLGLKERLSLPENIDVTPDPMTRLEKEFYKRWRYWDDVMLLPSTSALESGSIQHRPVKVTSSGDTYVTNGKIVVCTGGTSPLFNKALTWDQMLMIKDACYTRAQVLTGVRVIYRNDPGLLRAVLRLFLWHDQCLIKYNNPGYEILKNSEALAKAYLSLASGDIFGDQGPYGRMVEKIRKKEIDFGCSSDFLVDKFADVVAGCPIAHIVEIFGLLKVSGHPLIDPYKGGLSASEIAREPDLVLHKDALRADAMFKRKFTESFIRQRGKWPELEFENLEVGKTLQEYRAMNYLGAHRMQVPLEDWNNVKMRRNFEFDFSPNFLDMIDDKAISHYRSNIAANWDTDIPPISHRRLLVEMINREEISIREIVYRVMRRDIPFDWLIVCLHPKEREFKLEPRMFSMMVLEMRIFFAVTEMNLADSIYPFLDGLTMTDNKNQVLKRFLDMTAPPGNDLTRVLFLEIDLSRWNLRWRKLIIHLIGVTLDNLFGLPGIYTYVHTFFENSLFVVRVSGLRPKGIEQEYPPETELAWGGGSGRPHLGGCEGIVQKHWSIPTNMALFLALDGFNLNFKVAGQGDNQVVSIFYDHNPSRDEKEEALDLRNRLLTAISTEYKRMGQIVKPEECLESSRVITYSKDVFVNGLYYPTSLKFHSRLFPHSSQIFPSVRLNLGAIFSGAVAGAEHSSMPCRSLYLGLLQASFYLDSLYRETNPYGSYLSRTAPDSERFRRFVLTLPSSLGGFPVAGIVDFLYKGGGDPLSKELANLIVLENSTDDSRFYNRMLSQLMRDDIYQAEPKPGSLIKDPYSIPIRKPVTAIDGVTSQTMEAIGSDFKNISLSELVSTKVTHHKEEVIRELSKMRPFNPLIAHDLLDCSVYGLVDSIGKMFVATRTLQSIARTYDGSLVETMFNLEREGLAYMALRFSRIPGNPWHKTSIYSMANLLRDRWKCDKTGSVPPVGLTAYHPLDFKILLGKKAYESDGIHACVSGEGDKSLLESRGGYDPYIGTKTKEKRSEHGYRIVGSDTISEAFRKLQLISSQIGDDKRFKALIDLIGLTRSNTVLSTISDHLPTTSGGNLSHRYAARSGHQEAYCMGSPNFFTHCLISSDRSGELSGGKYDYPLMFQEFFLWGLSLLLYLHSSTRYITIVVNGEGLDILPDISITLTDPEPIEIIRLIDNPLAFVDTIRLERVRGIDRHRFFRPRDWFKKPSIKAKEKTWILESRLRQLLLLNNVGVRALDSSVTIFPSSSLDLAEIIGVGVEILIEAASNVVADFVLNSYCRTSRKHLTRWRLETMSLKLAATIVPSFSIHVEHPMLRTDPFVIQHQLYSRPSYVKTTLNDRIACLVSRIAARKAGVLPASYALRRVGITLSEPQMSAMVVVSTFVTRILRMWNLRSMINDKLYHALYGRFILAVTRAKTEERKKLSILLTGSRSLAMWFEQQSKHQIANSLWMISRKGVTYYNASAEELCRLFRGRVDVKDIVTPRAILNTISVPQVDLGTSRTYKNFPSITREITRIRNLKGLGSGMKDKSLWMSILPQLVKDRPVLVVGVGPGVVATCSLEVGAKFVYGLDMPDTTPLYQHGYVNYKPFFIALNHYDHQYFHVMEAITTSGDWFNLNVSHKVLLELPRETCIVLDMEIGGTERLVESIRPLETLRWNGPVIIKSYETRNQWNNCIAELDSWGVPFSLVSGGFQGSTDNIVMIIPSFSNRKSVKNPRYIVSVPAWDSSSTERGGPDKIAISDATCGCHDPTDNDTVEGVFSTMVRLWISTAGSYASRPSYSWWSRLLTGISTLYWVLMAGDVNLLKEWEESGEIVVISCVVIRCDWNVKRKNHILSYGSRLLKA